MRHIKLFTEKYTEVFVVDSKSKKVLPSSRSSYTYWYGEKRGKIDMEISINADTKQEILAKKIYEALKSQNLESEVKKIHVEFFDGKSETAK